MIAARRARDGVHHVTALPPVVVGELQTVAPRRKGERKFSAEGRLRAQRGRLNGTLSNMRRAKRPQNDLAAMEGRIAQVDQELHDRFGVPLPSQIELGRQMAGSRSGL